MPEEAAQTRGSVIRSDDHTLVVGTRLRRIDLAIMRQRAGELCRASDCPLETGKFEASVQFQDAIMAIAFARLTLGEREQGQGVASGAATMVELPLPMARAKPAAATGQASACHQRCRDRSGLVEGARNVVPRRCYPPATRATLCNAAIASGSPSSDSTRRAPITADMELLRSPITSATINLTSGSGSFNTLISSR